MSLSNVIRTARCRSKMSVRQRVRQIQGDLADWLQENTYWFEWARNKYWSLIPYDWRPMEVWYRLSCYLWHRYTTIKPRSLDFHTWCDRRNLLPHMMFEILSQFIEEECSPGVVDWEASAHTVIVDGKEVNVRREMQDLYDWWHNIYLKAYPRRSDAIWEIIEKCKSEDDSQPTTLPNGTQGYEWKLKFPNEEADKVYHGCMRELWVLEATMEAELNRRLHRLVECITYMWT